eukprot:4743933-Pyramimonas_sp.AAC.1
MGAQKTLGCDRILAPHRASQCARKQQKSAGVRRLAIHQHVPRFPPSFLHQVFLSHQAPRRTHGRKRGLFRIKELGKALLILWRAAR